jgi:hypothetical protein
MLLELVAIATFVLATGTFVYLRYGRSRLYRELAASQRSSSARRQAAGANWAISERLPRFEGNLAQISSALPAATFDNLRREINKLVETERSYLPTHKKGGTVAYETLCEKAPAVVSLYLSDDLKRLVSKIVGIEIVPTPLHDQSSCSVLFYERPGDHIGWHYDHNFYRGRHFTVLVNIVNDGREVDGLSAAKLMAKRGNDEQIIPTPPNTLVVFEGAKVLHKVTPIAAGERRVMLSMTYCADPRNSWVQGAARRIKDTAFFGIRALWT